jgi:hypothetical protein
MGQKAVPASPDTETNFKFLLRTVTEEFKAWRPSSKRSTASPLGQEDKRYGQNKHHTRPLSSYTQGGGVPWKSGREGVLRPVYRSRRRRSFAPALCKILFQPLLTKQHTPPATFLMEVYYFSDSSFIYIIVNNCERLQIRVRTKLMF